MKAPEYYVIRTLPVLLIAAYLPSCVIKYAHTRYRNLKALPLTVSHSLAPKLLWVEHAVVTSSGKRFKFPSFKRVIFTPRTR